MKKGNPKETIMYLWYRWTYYPIYYYRWIRYQYAKWQFEKQRAEETIRYFAEHENELNEWLRARNGAQ